MDHDNAIQIGLKNGSPHNEIARKIYLGYPTCAFIGNEEREFEILNKIANYFNVSYNTIQVVGSAKLGFSCHKDNVFNSKTSDLDIAIIDKDLFLKYVEIGYDITRGYRDLTKFPTNNKDQLLHQEYFNYIAKGIFRPDLMPYGEKKAEWRSFFTKLSTKNSDLFKSINAGIYSTAYFFEYKQKSSISSFKSRRGL